MSGTDKTKTGFDLDGPAIILVEPQLGENIGMAARAMRNFALSRLRIVNPRDGWPNIAASRAAAGADHILERGELFPSVEAATADLDLVFATTARAHDQAKPVVAPDAAALQIGRLSGSLMPPRRNPLAACRFTLRWRSGWITMPALSWFDVSGPSTELPPVAMSGRICAQGRPLPKLLVGTPPGHFVGSAMSEPA